MAQVLQRQPNRGFDTGHRMVAKTDEQRVQWPQYVGNQDRPVVHRQYHEVIEDVAVILEETFRIRTWVLSASPLLYGWPKVRLRDGVKVLKGTREYYNAHPMTEVPMEGTVRFMSMQLIEYNLTMSQKGIGARMHGAVLDSPAGPETLSKHMDAFAESAMMTMALQTAMKMVGTAWRQSVLSAGQESADMAYSRRIHNQLTMYAVLGKNVTEVIRVVDDVLSNNPELNTVYLPDRTDAYFNTNITPQAISVPLYTYDGVNYQAMETTQTLQPITTLKGGSVTVLPMTKFSIYSANREYQPLETTITIGEVYVDDQNMRLSPNQGIHYSGAMENIYVFDHTMDFWRKIDFTDGVRATHIWGSEETIGYSAYLLNFLNAVNRGKAKTESLRAAKIPMTYPVAARKADHPITGDTDFYLPELIGNLDEEHLTVDILEDMINSYVTGLRKNANFIDIFGTQGSGMESLESMRAEIEDLEYDAASFERMATLNISKRGNAYADPKGNVQFVGTRTPRNRIQQNSEMRPIVEWVPNANGSLDIDAQTSPVGMFNAAGLKQIAATAQHPMQQRASDAYRFLTRLADRHFEIFALTGNMTAKTHNMSPHLHRDDRAQVVLDTMYGRRIPAFLAAPASLIQPTQTAALPSQIELPSKEGVNRSKIVLTTGNSDDGFIVNFKAKIFFWTPQGVLYTLPANTKFPRISPKAGLLGIDAIIGSILPIIEEANARDWPEDIDVNATETLISLSLELHRGYVTSVLSAKGVSDREMLTKLYVLALMKRKDAHTLDDIAKVREIVTLYFNKVWKTSTRKKALDFMEKSELQIDPDLVANILTQVNKALTTEYVPLEEQDLTLIEAYAMLDESISQAISEIVKEAKVTKDVVPTRFVLVANNTVRTKGAYNILAGDSRLSDDLKSSLENLLDDIGNALGANNIHLSESALKVVRKNSNVDATIEDLRKASYFRAPLNFTMNLFKTVLRPEIVPWILPGDPRENFNTFVDFSDYGDALVASLMEHPYLVYSQGVIDPDHIQLPVANNQQNVAAHFDTYFANLVTAFGSDQAKRIMASGSGLGQIHKMLWYVRRNHFSNPLKRLAGVAILLTPHNRLDAMIHLHRNDIMLPFEIMYWRLWSTHKMGDILVMQAGISAGINMFNHERIMVARDNTRDSLQIRATLDMESHPVDPSLHVLAGPCQTRGYVGGHDATLVTDPNQLRQDEGSMQDMPSVIATINVRGQGATRQFPLSFVNIVPGRFDASHEPRAANANRQYWSGAPFYGLVYNGYFHHDHLDKFDSNSRTLTTTSYFSKRKQRNHLAFRGNHARFAPNLGAFKREIQGNGHRASSQFNSPGAQDYFNGNPFLQNTSMLVAHTLG